METFVFKMIKFTPRVNFSILLILIFVYLIKPALGIYKSMICYLTQLKTTHEKINQTHMYHHCMVRITRTGQIK